MSFKVQYHCDARSKKILNESAILKELSSIDSFVAVVYVTNLQDYQSTSSQNNDFGSYIQTNPPAESEVLDHVIIDIHNVFNDELH
jgi:hypothetical protein